MKPSATNNLLGSSRGQALTETLVAAFVLTLGLSLLAFLFVALSLHCSLVVLTQEAAACQLSTHTRQECQQRGEQQAQQLFQQWGLKHAQVQLQFIGQKAHLQAQTQWGQATYHWTIQESSGLETP